MQHKLWHATFQKLTRCGMDGVKPQDFGHLLPRLGESPLPGQGHAQVKVGLDIAGVQPERDRIVPDSLVDAPLVGQRRPEVIMGLGEGRLETEGFPVLLNGFRRLALATPALPRLLWACGFRGGKRIASV